MGSNPVHIPNKYSCINPRSHANSGSDIVGNGPERGYMTYREKEYRLHRYFSIPTTTAGQSKLNPPLRIFQQSDESPADGRVLQIVILKKCPWKHFTELEDFLITNRGEYMAHLAINYTAEQRQHNKKMTEQLL